MVADNSFFKCLLGKNRINKQHMITPQKKKWVKCGFQNSNNIYNAKIINKLSSHQNLKIVDSVICCFLLILSFPRNCCDRLNHS